MDSQFTLLKTYVAFNMLAWAQQQYEYERSSYKKEDDGDLFWEKMRLRVLTKIIRVEYDQDNYLYLNVWWIT